MASWESLGILRTQPIPPEMTRWREAVADRYVAPADVIAIGDSITEGASATLKSLRWLDRLQAMIRAAYPTPGVAGGEGYVPVANVTTSYPNGWSYNGNIGPAGTFGIARRSAEIKGPDGSAERTVFGTSITVAWTFTGTGNGGGGSFTVSIDGSVAATISTASSDGNAHGGGRQSILFSARGSHTVHIAWSSGGSAFFGGMFVYDGDESTGVRFIDCGQHGSSSSDWSRITSPFTAYLLEDEIAAIQPDLVILGLGGNDMIQGLTPASHLANMRDVIAMCKAGSTTTPSFLLHIGYALAADYAYPWSDYVANFYTIAESDPAVELLDFSKRLPRWNTDPYGFVAGDVIHPNDAGHLFYAQQFKEKLTDVELPRFDQSATFTQSTPASVFDVTHNLGFRPAGVSLFSPDYGISYTGFSVQHLDINTVRISMDVPTAVIVVLS